MPSVLIVDDERAIREIMERILRKNGFEVTSAADGLSGIEEYFARPTDVVIVDIIMPKQDGIAVIKKVRGSFPGARILAITGGGRHGPAEYRPGTIVTDAYLADAAKFGADAVLTKPFHRGELINIVRSLIPN